MKLVTKLVNVFARGAVLMIAASPMMLCAQELAKTDDPFQTQMYQWSSGVKGAGQIASHTVQVPNATWIRLNFKDANLGSASYIKLTSLADGASQTLNAKSLSQANNKSAYFNGDAVLVEMHAVRPDWWGIQLSISELEVGEESFSIESQCGSADNRSPSNNPAVARVTNGCTAWILDNDNLVTAGHCADNMTAIEFNVPQSNSNGGRVRSAPRDQYTIIRSSIEFSDNGPGNDWAVFRVQNNSETGRSPRQEQGSSFKLVRTTNLDTIRITGHGVDSGSRNAVQQTHTGDFVSLSGGRIRYRVDTEGGNSGSPVIDNATGDAVGVHTHAGCNTNGTGSNQGTHTNLTAFWDAANDGASSSIPNVTFGSPTGNITLDQGYNSLYVSVNASDSDGIDFVRLFIDGQLVRQENFAPYEWGKSGAAAAETLGLSAGTHTFRAEATDEDGDVGVATFTLTVGAPSTGGGGGGVSNCQNYNSGRTELDLRNGSCVDIAGGLNGKTLQVWDSDTNRSCNFRGSVSSANGSGSLNVTSNYVAARNFTGSRIVFSSSNNCNFVKMRAF